MDDQAGVLQQRIEIAPIRRGGQQALERIGREQHEHQETDGDEPHHAEHARHHVLRQIAAEHGDRDHPQRQEQHPQQQRTLVAAPDARELVDIRQRRVRIGGDVLHRKVVVQKRPRQAGERERDKNELALRGRARDGNPAGIVLPHADQRQSRQHDRDAQRHDEREMADLRNHGEILLRLTA
jgi:hypothetical protein